MSRPGIYGLPLNGRNNSASISDTDGGALDNDKVWDRAVGPMQFIPSTWDVVGVDANGDGEKNPQDINDAALATGVYLCAGQGDLSTDSGARKAVMRYNHSQSYVNLVTGIARAYERGDFSQTPNHQTSPTTLTSHQNDQTRPPSVRNKNKRGNDKHQGGHNGDASSGGGVTTTPGSTDGGNTGGGTNSGNTGDTGDTGGGSTSGGHSGNSGDGGSDPTDNIKDNADHTTEPVVKLITSTEARGPVRLTDRQSVRHQQQQGSR